MNNWYKNGLGQFGILIRNGSWGFPFQELLLTSAPPFMRFIITAGKIIL